MSVTLFEPIDNQRVAEIAGVGYNQHPPLPGTIVYGITHQACKRLHDLRRCGPFILLTSFSDASVEDRHVHRAPPNMVKWFTTNSMTTHPKVEAMPIGFSFNRDAQEMALEFREAVLEGGRAEQCNLMYMNFMREIPRDPNPRAGLYEKFGQYTWVTKEGGCVHTYTSHLEFYQGLLTHPYTLSPPGAGLDCHRHWEAMWLGSIPIVLRSQAVSLLEDMPALLVDSWDEVTEERLVRELDGLRARFDSPAMQKMDMGFWRQRIYDAVDGLRHP
jgi:hypothetical protein